MKLIIPYASGCRMMLKTNSHHHLAAEYYRHSFLNSISAADCQELVLERWQDLPKGGSVREDQK
jgi:hypothetical protein